MDADDTVCRPLILLDFDGVINCFPEAKVWRRGKQARLDWMKPDDPRRSLYDPENNAFLIDCSHRVDLGRAHGGRWNLKWSSELVSRLKALHDDGLADMLWLTSWAYHTNLLNDVLGFMGEKYGDPSYLDDAVDDDSIQIRTAFWFDAMDGAYGTDKIIYVENLLKDMKNSGEMRPIIWCDDEEINSDNEKKLIDDGFADVCPILMVQPDERIGINRRQMKTIEDFVGKCNDGSMKTGISASRADSIESHGRHVGL